MRRLTAWRGRTAMAAVAMMLIAGCSDDGEPEAAAATSPPTSTSTGASGNASDAAGSTPDPASATVSAPNGAVSVVGGKTPGALSVAVSKALFDSAPAVVVAAATDPKAIAEAARTAAERGVPVLLDDGVSRLAGSAASGTADPVQAEINRLRPRTVLAVGAGATERFKAMTDPGVVADAAKLPPTRPPAGLVNVSVLLGTGGDAAAKAGIAAAGATVRAAGANLVPVVGGADPRSDPKAVAALAAKRPKHVLAVGSAFGSAAQVAARVATASTGTQLPGGGQVVFPGRRFVAMYGHPGTPSLGVLGEQDVTKSVTRAAGLARAYAPLSKVPVVPAFEIIATVAQGAPGPDGDYSYEAPVSQLRPWVERAGKAGMYVMLDLQSGRSDFLSQAKLYTDLLKLPYVGLALDPEWRLAPNQKPLGQIGGVDAAEINKVSAWLADLTAKAKLPQKVLVLHQFRLSMIRNSKALDTGHDEVAVLIHMDGQGPTGSKDGTWRSVVGAAPAGVPFGWKNFYDEDTPMLSPAQTMARKPTPLMISYQ